MSQTSAIPQGIRAPSVSGFHSAAREASRTGGQLVVNNQGQFAVKHKSWLGRKVLQLKQRLFPSRISEQNQRVLYSLAYALRSEKNISKYQDLRQIAVHMIKDGANPSQLAKELDNAVSVYEHLLGPSAMRKREGNSVERAQSHAETFMTNYFERQELDTSYEYRPYASDKPQMRGQQARMDAKQFHADALTHQDAYNRFTGHLATKLRNAVWVPGTENGRSAAPCKTPEGHFTDAFLLRALNMTVRQETKLAGEERNHLPAQTRGSNQTDGWLARQYMEMQDAVAEENLQARASRTHL